jgi:polyribonucleotide nucleotidyltransferase
MNEVQVILTVMSLNPEVQTDVIAMIGASAALSISDLPFNGPIGGARVGYINDNYVLNPSLSAMDDSKLNLMVAGSKEAILMVESEANELSEEIMLGAVMYGHEQMQTVIDVIHSLQQAIVLFLLRLLILE